MWGTIKNITVSQICSQVLQNLIRSSAVLGKGGCDHVVLDYCLHNNVFNVPENHQPAPQWTLKAISDAMQPEGFYLGISGHDPVISGN